MKFEEEEFPGLKGKDLCVLTDDPGDGYHYEYTDDTKDIETEFIFSKEDIQKHCLDKQRVREIVEKIESYMIEQHTQPNDSNQEFARGWREAIKELEHFLKKELGL